MYLQNTEMENNTLRISDSNHHRLSDSLSDTNPGTFMRVTRTVGTKELRENTLIVDDVKKKIHARNGTMDYEWDSTHENIVLQEDKKCIISAIYIVNNVGIFADLICFQVCKTDRFQQMIMLQKVCLDHTNTQFRFFEQTDDVLKFNLVTEDHSWGKKKRIQTDEDGFSLDVHDCDDTWNTLRMRLVLNDAGDISGIDLNTEYLLKNTHDAKKDS